MDAESKAKAWFGKIFNKLERIVVEMDTSQNTNKVSNSSDPSECESARVEPNKVVDDSSSGTCSHDPPSHQNFENSGRVGVQGDSLKENLSATSLLDEDMLNLTPANTFGNEEAMITNEESQVTNTLVLSAGDALVFPGEEVAEEGRVESCIDVVSKEPPSTQSSLESFGTAVECNDDLVPAPGGISTDDINLNPIDTKILDVPVQDNEANMTSSDADNPVDVINGKSDVAPLDTNALHDINLNSIDTEILDLPIQDNEANMRSSDADNPVDVINGKSDVAPLDTNALHDINLNSIDTEILDLPIQDNEANMRSSDADNPVDVINGKSDVAPLDTNALHDINLNSIDTEILDLPIQDNEANMRSSDADNPDDVINVKSDVAPLDTNALHDLAFREDQSYVDENALYAVRVRIKKLRSFKRKILDVLTSKRRREEEYEQLAIWFGDADMGFDLSTGEESKPIDTEDYQWELL